MLGIAFPLILREGDGWIGEVTAFKYWAWCDWRRGKAGESSKFQVPDIFIGGSQMLFETEPFH